MWSRRDHRSSRVFARSLEDIALGLEQTVGYDERDPDTRPRPRVPYRAVLGEEPPLPPMFALIKTPRWDRVDADAQEAFAELAQHLGAQVEEIEPTLLEEAWEWQRTIMDVEVAESFAREWEKGRERLSPRVRGRIEHGREVRAGEYLQALTRVAALQAGSPSCSSSVRRDPHHAGERHGARRSRVHRHPMFCSLWTMCGMPAVTLPLMQSANGLPLGVQLVGPRQGDGRLLGRRAGW